MSRDRRKPTRGATGERRSVYELGSRGGGALLRARKKICITSAGNAAVPSARPDFVLPFVDSLRRRVRRDWDNFCDTGEAVYVHLFGKFFLAVSSAATAEVRERKKKKREERRKARLR